MSPVVWLKNKVNGTLRRFMLEHFHTAVVDRDWQKWKGYKVDWEHPRDINEKIQWLLCYSDTSEWSVLSDKVRVRDYVSSKGFGDLLVPLLGVWDKAEDIDFDLLPEKFVMKCNHDSGSFKIVDKSQGFDPATLRAQFSRCLKRKVGYYWGELFYNAIEPKVLAEPFLGTGASSPVDYKVRCFSGKPFCIMTCSNRTANTVCLDLYDLDWQAHPEALVFSDHCLDGGGRIPRPACLDRMLQAASALSAGFPEVRVDFYVVDEKPYFGEMTFSSSHGMMTYFTDAYLVELGNQCVLPRK